MRPPAYFVRAAGLLLAVLGVPQLSVAQGPSNVLVITNDLSPLSREIAQYYVEKRTIPLKNVCHIRVSPDEDIDRVAYDKQIAAPIAACLRKGQLTEQILYFATTAGVPLRIAGKIAIDGDMAAVDSELALLYTDMHTAKPHPVHGTIPNPFFGQRAAKFTHPQFPIYLVTRLAAYDIAGVRAMIDRGLAARNQGKFVIDQSDDDDAEGNNWLRDAVLRLPADRVVFDASKTVLYDQKNVIGYAGWGSNDKNRHQRYLHFQWLPGAIATEYVSTNARTFVRPPKDWNISDWNSRSKWFAGSPQTMTADYLEEGASAATGHVTEPYLAATPHPDLLLPAYFSGRNLAESFYMSIPFLSWQNIVAGDPLMTLGPPTGK